MNLHHFVHMTELLLACAFLQQSIEHFYAPRDEQRLFIPRAVLCVLLACGFETRWVELALLVNALFILKRFQGPYNGGSDRMGLLILCCLCIMRFIPAWQQYAFGYLAMQVVLSYFIAGLVKVMNPEWLSGRALQDVMLFSAYPASDAIRTLADRPHLLYAASWMVMLFELLFPFALLSHTGLLIALAMAAVFHLANACLFGLNRFFWIWLAAYPSLLWLQQRIFGV